MAQTAASLKTCTIKTANVQAHHRKRSQPSQTLFQSSTICCSTRRKFPCEQATATLTIPGHSEIVATACSAPSSELIKDNACHNGRNLEEKSPIATPKAKRTKGRVKIKMQLVENRLRRQATFSKRKTNLLKKAYELYTLTGAEVMVVVASETSHVYTYATPRLQPMIADTGKSLIQTFLSMPSPSKDHSDSDRADASVSTLASSFSNKVIPKLHQSETVSSNSDNCGKNIIVHARSSIIPDNQPTLTKANHGQRSILSKRTKRLSDDHAAKKR